MQNILSTAAILTDEQLLSRLEVLARNERQASVELVAHLAVLDTRPSLYAADGYGSLFSYCTRALHLSEDAACTRIEAARACRRFPRILDMLAAGALSLTSIRLLGKHLTEDNHDAVLVRAAHRSRREVEELVAELAPRPDVRTLVRKLPIHPPSITVGAQPPAAVSSPADPTAVESTPGTAPALTPPSRPVPRPIIQPLAPERYRVQFTLGAEAHARLRRLQELLRREIPDGDPAAIVDRALALLLEKVERRKQGAARRPRLAQPIRPGTDRDAPEGTLPPRVRSRAVKREVSQRDRGQCAFVSASGRRCEQRAFVEYHHQIPYTLRGQATPENTSLRCWRPNQYEAELVFGSAEMAAVRSGRRGRTGGAPGNRPSADK